MGNEMLRVENVSAGYDGRYVLHEVSLEVVHGEFLGLIGPNGSGKTTLLRVISGFLPPTKGIVRLGGRDLRRIGRRELAQTMACLMQDSDLGLPFTVQEVVLMGRAPHLSRIGWETQGALRVALRAMACADVLHLADRPITEISGGERQRAFIAMCLAQEPQMLLLDEPTNHLDIAHQLSVLDLIRSLNHQMGMTVVAVFHDLNHASEYCDRLLMLNQGRVENVGAPADVLTRELIREVYHADVLIRENPVSSRPHMVISAGMNGRPDRSDGPRRTDKNVVPMATE